MLTVLVNRAAGCISQPSLAGDRAGADRDLGADGDDSRALRPEQDDNHHEGEENIVRLGNQCSMRCQPKLSSG